MRIVTSITLRFNDTIILLMISSSSYQPKALWQSSQLKQNISFYPTAELFIPSYKIPIVWVPLSPRVIILSTGYHGRRQNRCRWAYEDVSGAWWQLKVDRIQESPPSGNNLMIFCGESSTVSSLKGQLRRSLQYSQYVYIIQVLALRPKTLSMFFR